MTTRDKLIALFIKFPGIGPRQAERFVYFLLRSHPSLIEELITHLRALKGAVALCESCYGYFEKGSTHKNLCETCSRSNADESLLMVVAKDVDMETVKKAEKYEGRYFILGGLLPLMEKQKNELRINELCSRVKERAEKGVLQEIILALSANPEGDHTTHELQKHLAPYIQAHNIKITTLGRGLSTGTELEYSDAETIKHAMENRH